MNTFNSLRRFSILAAVALLTLAGCQRVKSENPLSPTIAGPIDGVTITLPRALQPAVGQKIKDADQPVSIVIETPQSNSPRPFTITVQIGADANLNNVVFTQSGIAPAAEGQTRLTLP